jgi:DNA-binding CsgD family transcriptional regulator
MSKGGGVPTDDASGWMFGADRADGGRVTARSAVEQPSVDLGPLATAEIEQPCPSWLGVPAEDHFIGRRTELNALDQELDQVCAQGCRVVLVEGPAGIGKTALVRRFLAGRDGVRAFWASGEEDESTVSYALVDQLLGALGLPPSTFLCHPDRTSPVEKPIEVGRRVLMALRGLTERSPVVLVLDDIQWADRDSLRSVLFVLRRMAAIPVLTVLVTRSTDVPEHFDGLLRLIDGLSGKHLPLGPLASLDVQALAAVAGVAELPALTAQQLCIHTVGNPRDILSLFAEVSPERWREWEPMLPAPRRYSRLVSRRLARCSNSGRRLVEAASTLGDNTLLRTAGVVAGVAEPLLAVEEADAAGLLAVSERTPIRLVFPHPLVRAAVYGQLGPATRDRLHRAAAETAQGEGQALHHLASVVQPPDDQMARALERYARQSQAEGAFAEAVWALTTASRLSGDRAQREQRMLAAVDLIGAAGDGGRSSAGLCDQDAFALGPLRDALVELAFGQMLRRTGRRRAAAERLAGARERLAGLRAQPHLQRCEQELAACALAPGKRAEFDPTRLTAQESAVARLVAEGMSNRQVASELFISIKTVQFHLTHIYAKLGVGSRAELAARFRDSESRSVSAAPTNAGARQGPRAP